MLVLIVNEALLRPIRSLIITFMKGQDSSLEEHGILWLWEATQGQS